MYSYTFYSTLREIDYCLIFQSQELRKQDLPLVMWLLAGLCVPFPSLALLSVLSDFSASGSLPQSSGSVIGIPESEIQVPNDSVLVTLLPRAGTLQ